MKEAGDLILRLLEKQEFDVTPSTSRQLLGTLQMDSILAYCIVCTECSQEGILDFNFIEEFNWNRKWKLVFVFF